MLDNTIHQPSFTRSSHNTPSLVTFLLFRQISYIYIYIYIYIYTFGRIVWIKTESMSVSPLCDHPIKLTLSILFKLKLAYTLSPILLIMEATLLVST